MNAFIFWSVHRFFAVRRAAQRASEAGCPEAVDGVIQATAGSFLLSKLRIIRSWRGLGCNMHPSGVWGKAPSSSPSNFGLRAPAHAAFFAVNGKQRWS